MNILILSEYFPSSEKANLTGGVEARAFNVAKRLAKKNCVKIITSWKKGEKRYDKFLNFEVYRVGPNHPYSHSGSIFSRFKLVNAAIKKSVDIGDIDVVDGYSYLMYMAAYKIGKRLRIPSVITYHETWIGSWIKNKGLVTGIFGEIWERLVLKKKFDKIISVSDFTRKKLIELGKKDIDVVPNGVDISGFKKIKAKKFSEPTICCINRLTPKKRTEDIIKAISIVRIEIPDIKLKIIGKGVESENLKRLVHDLGVEKNVEFLGFMNDYNDVIITLKSSHVFCSASVVEGFGMALIEAIACDVPYVCSDIEPFKEVTENGKGGYIFKAENYKDLAIKLIRLLKNKRIYKEKILEGRILIKKYGWINITKHIEEIYKDILY